MSEYKDWGEYRDDWIKKMNNKDYYWREQEILAGKNHLKDKKGGNKILKMKTFFNDIAHHLVNNGDEQLAKDIFDRLWLNPQALPDVSESRCYEISDYSINKYMILKHVYFNIF